MGKLKAFLEADIHEMSANDYAVLAQCSLWEITALLRAYGELVRSSTKFAAHWTPDNCRAVKKALAAAEPFGELLKGVE